MIGQIKTKWHRLIELFARRKVALDKGPAKDVLAAKISHEISRHPKVRQHISDLPEFLSELNDMPRFFVSRELRDMLAGPEVTKTIEAMYRAGVAKLPYDHLVIEIDNPTTAGEPTRTFMFVRDASFLTNLPEKLRGTTTWAIDTWHCRMVRGEELAVFSPNTVLLTLRDGIEVDGRTGFGWHYATLPTVPKTGLQEFHDAMSNAAPYDAQNAGGVVTMLIAMLNTRGTVLERHEAPEKLNRKRVARGEPPIPAITTIRIGQVFDRDGKVVHTVKDGDRAPVRVHWRRGHTRMNPCGPGGKERKLVFIKPCLVNYDGPVEDAPAPRYEVRS